LCIRKIKSDDSKRPASAALLFRICTSIFAAELIKTNQLNPYYMKKFLYILLFATVSSMSISACTEESVEPKKEDSGTTGGGTGGDPVKP
jgi:hypothetical protein